MRLDWNCIDLNFISLLLLISAFALTPSQVLCRLGHWPAWRDHSEFLQAFNFNVPSTSTCTDTLHFMTTSPAELAFRLEHGLDADGLCVQIDPVRNRTVIAARAFKAREYVCEYAGEAIGEREMWARIAAWPVDNFGYILTVKNTLTGDITTVDASIDSDRFCRLISHSWKRQNVDAYPFRYRNETRLIFLATKDIKPGEELYFDYGYKAMTPTDLEIFPWLHE